MTYADKVDPNHNHNKIDGYEKRKGDSIMIELGSFFEVNSAAMLQIQIHIKNPEGKQGKVSLDDFVKKLHPDMMTDTLREFYVISLIDPKEPFAEEMYAFVLTELDAFAPPILN